MALINFSLEDIGKLATGLREALTGEKIKDPVELAKAQLVAEQLENVIRSGQLAINEEEAKSPRLFVAGWRPFVGWGCGFALLYAGLFEPLAEFIAKVVFGYQGEFPKLDTTITMQVLFGLLGLGAMRSHDKLKGVDTK